MSASTASLSAGCTHAVACVPYTDAKVCIDWLVRTFGAEARYVFEAPDGSVTHAELWFGAGCVMTNSITANKFRSTPPGQVSVYIVCSDAAAVDRLHESAVNAGATVVISLRDTDYGSHDFACLDPEGNFWAFGTYAPAA